MTLVSLKWVFLYLKTFLRMRITFYAFIQKIIMKSQYELASVFCVGNRAGNLADRVLTLLGLSKATWCSSFLRSPFVDTHLCFGLPGRFSVPTMLPALSASALCIHSCSTLKELSGQAFRGCCALDISA